MIEVADTDDDLARFAAIRTAASPRFPEVPPRRQEDRLVLLAGDDGCGVAGRSDLADSVSVAVYVRPESRGRGIGTALVEPLLAHARTLAPRDRLFATVDSLSAAGLAFARRYGLVEVDREVELRRPLGDEPAPSSPAGLEVVSIDERPELLDAAYAALAVDGYADLPTPSPLEVTREAWLEEEATLPAGSFVALEDGRLVGYAGLLADPTDARRAEHGLTVVARSHRRRGIATALKRRQLAWAAAAGFVELVTWTQGRNSAMQRVNEQLGYVAAPPWLKLQGPLP